MFNLYQSNSNVKILTTAELIAEIQSRFAIHQMSLGIDNVIQVSYINTPDNKVNIYGAPSNLFAGAENYYYSITDNNAEAALEAIIAAMPELVITPEEYMLQHVKSRTGIQPRPTFEPNNTFYNPLTSFGYRPVHTSQQGPGYYPTTVSVLVEREETPIYVPVFRFINVVDYDDAMALFENAKNSLNEARHNHTVVDLFKALGEGTFTFETTPNYYVLNINGNTLYIRNQEIYMTDTDWTANELLSRLDRREWYCCAYATINAEGNATYYNTLYEFIHQLVEARDGIDANVGPAIFANDNPTTPNPTRPMR